MDTPFSILSVADLNGDIDLFSEELGSNFQEWGFCGLKDHGIDTVLVKEVQNIFADFFSRDNISKLNYHDPKLNGSRGYTPFKIETPKDGINPDLKEFWHVGRELESNDSYKNWMQDNLYVTDIPLFQEKTNELFLQFDTLGNKILRGVARYLDLNLDFFQPITNKGNSLMRVIHYPPVGIDECGERAGAHEDINLITLLIGGQQAGLELLSNKEEWLRVSVDEGTIICNIGDMLQRLTNNRLKSTTHRVKAIGDEVKTSRYSIPFFVHPNPDWFIETLPSQINSKSPNLYPKGILAEDYLQERLKEIKLS